MYHLIYLTKYHKAIFTDEVERMRKDVCEEIAKMYDVEFIETDEIIFIFDSISPDV